MLCLRVACDVMCVVYACVCMHVVCVLVYECMCGYDSDRMCVCNVVFLLLCVVCGVCVVFALY